MKHCSTDVSLLIESFTVDKLEIMPVVFIVL